jgi:hypothetical protein
MHGTKAGGGGVDDKFSARGITFFCVNSGTDNLTLRGRLIYLKCTGFLPNVKTEKVKFERF